MSNSWKSKKLGDTLTLQRGFDLPHRMRREGQIPIISSSGISGWHDRAQVNPPGIVTGRYGTVGGVFYIDVPFWPLNTTLYVRDFKGNDPLYLSYMLRTIDFKSHSGKSGVPGVNRNDLHKLYVKIPTTSEQRAIAAALSDVDELIGALAKLIAKKRAIKLATMQQLLTGKTRLPGFSGEWKSRQLGSMLWFLPTANNPRKDLLRDGDLGYIHYGDIHAHPTPTLDWTKCDLHMINRDKVGSAAELQEGDLVIVDASEDMVGVGKSVEIINLNAQPVVAGLHTIACRGNDTDWALGFKSYLQFIPTFKQAIEKVATGISVYAISKRQISEVELPLPEFSEQEAITSVLSDMDAEITALEQRLDKTKAIKKGMMHMLLTGRVRLVKSEDAS